MGSITQSITDFFKGKEALSERLRKMQPACRSGTGSKKVSIKVFDRKNVLRDAVHSVSAAKQDLETFFNSLSATPGLAAAIGQDLQTFTFEVKFVTRDSMKAERDAFGMMDFPVYLESTLGAKAFTANDSQELLLAHKIPETTEVFAPAGDEGAVDHEPLQTYTEVENFIPKHDVFGVGVPGTYLLNGHTTCRKIAIVKVNDLIAGINSIDLRQKRFLRVVKHEVGHMLGMAHARDTLMDKRFDVVLSHPAYTIGQVLIVDSTLNILARG